MQAQIEIEHLAKDLASARATIALAAAKLPPTGLGMSAKEVADLRRVLLGGGGPPPIK